MLNTEMTSLGNENFCLIQTIIHLVEQIFSFVIEELQLTINIGEKT